MILSRTLSIWMNQRPLYTFVENRTPHLKHQADCHFFPCLAEKTRRSRASALCPTSSSFGPKSGKPQMSSVTPTWITRVTNKVRDFFSLIRQVEGNLSTPKIFVFQWSSAVHQSSTLLFRLKKVTVTLPSLLPVQPQMQHLLYRRSRTGVILSNMLARTPLWDSITFRLLTLVLVTLNLRRNLG